VSPFWAFDARVLGRTEGYTAFTNFHTSRGYLAYLEEFTFRFNRRRTPMAAFQTLLGLASSAHGPTTYDMLYRSESTR
jgi:hypothetical protein